MKEASIATVVTDYFIAIQGFDNIHDAMTIEKIIHYLKHNADTEPFTVLLNNLKH
jgi:hypothetical protein